MCTMSKCKIRIITILLTLITWLSSSADVIIVDNIKYGISKDVVICNGIADTSIICSDIVIPDSIKVNGINLPVCYISGGAFEGIHNIHSIRLPETIKRIYMASFAACDNLDCINIPTSLQKIPDNAFYDSNLVSISVSPQNPYYFIDGSNAIINKETNELIAGSAKTVIPTTISTLGEKAFSKRRKLKQISIPSSVVLIQNDCFMNCDSLISVDFSDDNTGNCNLYIATGAFMNCNSLQFVNLPNRLDTLGCAFVGCSQLSQIYIPRNVSYIAGAQFGYCTNMQSVIVDSNNKKYDSRNNCNAIIETKTKKLSSACPATVIPNGIKTIGEFSYTEVAIDSIFIPNSVKNIEVYAFQHCAVRSVVIPKRINRIDLSSFGSCNNLRNIYLMQNTPPILTDLGNVLDADDLLDALENTTEYDCLKNVKIYVPSKSQKKYKRHPVWKVFNIVSMKN